jgi:aminopeptidase N
MSRLGIVLASLCAAVALAVPGSAGALERPSPGAPGIGDRLFPTLGNGGYDVLHYDLDLRYATAAPSQGIDGTATIVARATQSLSRFDLDFGGSSVGAVAVNGRPARFARVGDELVITPRLPLAKGRPFVVQVKRYTAEPLEPNPDVLLSTLRQRVGDATFRQIERAWVSRYRDGVASTADFIALASRVSGQDLGRFLNRWIYGTTTPPMPGHPDWTVDPVETAAARTLAAPAELPFRPR